MITTVSVCRPITDIKNEEKEKTKVGVSLFFDLSSYSNKGGSGRPLLPNEKGSPRWPGKANKPKRSELEYSKDIERPVYSNGFSLIKSSSPYPGLNCSLREKR